MNEGTKPKVAPVAVVEHDDLPIVEWSAVDQDRGTVLELEQGGPAAVLLVVGFAVRTILQVSLPGRFQSFVTGALHFCDNGRRNEFRPAEMAFLRIILCGIKTTLSMTQAHLLSAHHHNHTRSHAQI